MKRRFFIKRISLTFSVLAGGIAGLSYLRQFYPPFFIRKQNVKIGDYFNYPIDTYTYLDKLNIFIYRDYEGVKAVSAVCTHLGCILKKSTSGFECPCHGSVFSDRGEVQSGPAPLNLKWYNIHTASDGKLMVDLNHTVDPDYKYRIS